MSPDEVAGYWALGIVYGILILAEISLILFMFLDGQRND